MNRPRSGFTLIEMLIVVAIIAVLVGVGSAYYQDTVEEARLNTAKLNLKTVKEAMARFFKDRMVYPNSLDDLGPYLQQSVTVLVLTPIQPIDPNAEIQLQVPTAVGANVFHVDEADTEWIAANLNPGKQFRNIRVKYNTNNYLE